MSEREPDSPLEVTQTSTTDLVKNRDRFSNLAAGVAFMVARQASWLFKDELSDIFGKAETVLGPQRTQPESENPEVIKNPIRRGHQWINDRLVSGLKIQLNANRRQALDTAIASARSYSPYLSQEDYSQMNIGEKVVTKVYSFYPPIRKHVLEETGITASLATMQVARAAMPLGLSVRKFGDIALNLDKSENHKFAPASRLIRGIGQRVVDISNFLTEAPMQAQLVSDVKNTISKEDTEYEVRAKFNAISEKYRLGKRDLDAAHDLLESARMYPILSLAREAAGWGSYSLMAAVPPISYAFYSLAGNTSWETFALAYGLSTTVRFGLTYFALKGGYSFDLQGTLMAISGQDENESKIESEAKTPERKPLLGALWSVGFGGLTQFTQTAALIPFTAQFIGYDDSMSLLLASYIVGDNLSFQAADALALLRQRKRVSLEKKFKPV